MARTWRWHEKPARIRIYVSEMLLWTTDFDVEEAAIWAGSASFVVISRIYLVPLLPTKEEIPSF
jgi:hypothetical protein